jgi:hypothetical protein
MVNHPNRSQIYHGGQEVKVRVFGHRMWRRAKIVSRDTIGAPGYEQFNGMYTVEFKDGSRATIDKYDIRPIIKENRR